MPKDDQTWLNIAYIVFGILAGFVFWKAFNTIGLHYGWVEKYDQWFPMANLGVAVVCGGVGSFWIRQDAERHQYFLSAVGELRKVTWPSADDTRRMTIIVAVVVAIFSAILGVFDMAWAQVLKWILA